MSAHGSAQIYNTQAEARIDIQSNGEFYEIIGYTVNKTDANLSLRYVLTVNKNDTLGNNQSLAKNEQQGRFILAPNSNKKLASLTVNSTEKDRTIALLLIYNEENKIIAKDRIVLQQLEETKKKRKAAIQKELDERSLDVKAGNNDGADGTLTGIVVESTKTKPGRDFFKAFSSIYQRKAINGEKVVVIKEILAVGSNTKIELEIDNTIVFQFFVNPRSDYIDQMANIAVARTENYFVRLRKNRNLIKKY
ncbi:MAG: curli production assembly/transport protein CsgE [Bacteroidetes bacterium]|nr:curli production assembly/transport protein CsgE [Bacteroidota bacterium]